MPYYLKDLTPDAQTKVLRLHHEAFGGDTACKQCPGNCCRGCANSGGYRQFDEPKEVFDARKKAFGWTNEAGFKGEHGCKLPVTERSYVCLAFACGGVGRKEDGFYPPEGVNKPFTPTQYDKAFKIRSVICKGE